METSARHLAFHGAIVLLIGLLCGGPYGRAVNRGAAPHVIHSWRVAHASLPMGAILMFTIAALLSSFAVASSVKWSIAVALIVSSYAFWFSLPLAAVVGHRGLSSEGPASAKLVYLGNMLGALSGSNAGSRLCGVCLAEATPHLNRMALGPRGLLQASSPRESLQCQVHGPCWSRRCSMFSSNGHLAASHAFSRHSCPTFNS